MIIPSSLLIPLECNGIVPVIKTAVGDRTVARTRCRMAPDERQSQSLADHRRTFRCQCIDEETRTSYAGIPCQNDAEAGSYERRSGRHGDILKKQILVTLNETCDRLSRIRTVLTHQHVRVVRRRKIIPV